MGIADFHPVFFGDEAIQKLSEYLREHYKNRQVVIITDQNTHEHCLQVIEDKIEAEHIEVVQIPSGEENKTIEVCEQVWQVLLDLGINRNAIIINLGGGMVTDLGGFVAAIYKRGVDFLHVPTTLMGMVDAAIGGKTGVNLNSLKNQLGVFVMPKAVVSYPAFLQTLPENEVLSGYAEVVKHALVADEKLWEALPGSLNDANWEELIEKAYQVKVGICQNDFREAGERKLLNFGHTVGHAIESYLLEAGEHITHGECVAAGMLCECYLSLSHGLDEDKLKIIEQHINKHFKKIPLRNSDIPALIENMHFDKKNTSQGINFTLLETIGKGKPDFYVGEVEIKAALEYYIQL